MIRVALYLIVLAALAYGVTLLVENPGHITLTWYGTIVEAPAALLVAGVAVAAVLAWSLVLLVLALPSFVSRRARRRRREKGYAALSRGLIALGAGDPHEASRAAVQANRRLPGDPLAIMLRAQAAYLSGENRVAQDAYQELAQSNATRLLGLRGLHEEALRRGDDEAARHYAAEAHRAMPLSWSAKALLEQRAAEGDWEKALSTVETSLAARLIDRETGERQRAVLETAIAMDKEATAPDVAFSLARSALRRAPDLSPALVVAARLLTRRGDIRKASRLIEKHWPRCQHPDVAQAYLDVRPGDSTQDRLDRAKRLMGLSAYDPVSRTTVARAALAAKDFAAARGAMAPLIAEGKRPSVRQCMLMAELEEAEHGDQGLWREWLARAARAPLDPAWIADGIVYDAWAPASPTTGRLDAFVWQAPAERLGPTMDAMPAPAPVDTLPTQPAKVEVLPPAAAPPAAEAAQPIATTPGVESSGRTTPQEINGHAAEPAGPPSATTAKVDTILLANQASVSELRH